MTLFPQDFLWCEMPPECHARVMGRAVCAPPTPAPFPILDVHRTRMHAGPLHRAVLESYSEFTWRLARIVVWSKQTHLAAATWAGHTHQELLGRVKPVIEGLPEGLRELDPRGEAVLINVYVLVAGLFVMGLIAFLRNIAYG